MRLIAQLTMPNVASWNGKWSGAEDFYTIAINVTPKKANELIGNYRYRWSDGWCANVNIREAKPRERVSNKFCGYNWMVDSIKKHGKIVDKD